MRGLLQVCTSMPEAKVAINKQYNNTCDSLLLGAVLVHLFSSGSDVDKIRPLLSLSCISASVLARPRAFPEPSQHVVRRLQVR